MICTWFTPKLYLPGIEQASGVWLIRPMAHDQGKKHVQGWLVRPHK